MPVFSKVSLDRLATCHPDLQRVMREVIRYMDVSILEGHRGEDRQNRMYRDGKSQLRWPKSKHNSTPSRAVDVAPYPINWMDTKRFYYMAGLILGIAATMGIRLRWGGDWDRDTTFHDQTFDDLPHFELVTEKEKDNG